MTLCINTITSKQIFPFFFFLFNFEYYNFLVLYTNVFQILIIYIETENSLLKIVLN